jgi:hypothetical protein
MPANWIADERLQKRQSPRQDELPSWLMSLVTHMSLLALVGALAATPRAQGRFDPIVITLSAAEGNDESNSHLLASIVAQDQPQHDEAQDGARVDDTPQVSQSNEITPPSQSPSGASGEMDGEQDATHNDSFVVVKLLKPDVQLSSLATNELKRLEEPSPRSRSRDPRSASSRLTEQDMDKIVDRFIQFDIGQLRPNASSQARNDFQRLGPEAIPALVRGLNKAAGLRASCPIGVISHRLSTLLKQTDDPALIRYALENIGRGVDKADPHYGSVQSLTNRLRNQFGRLIASWRPSAGDDRYGQTPVTARPWDSFGAEQAVVDDGPSSRAVFGARPAASRVSGSLLERAGNPNRWNSPDSLLRPAAPIISGHPDRSVFPGDHSLGPAGGSNGPAARNWRRPDVLSDQGR